MKSRKIVKIDEELCTGCGECVPACAEGAIQIVDGVARLVADNLCDGLGACLGDCPEGAISIEEREADDFDEAAVEQHLSNNEREAPRAAPAWDAHQRVSPLHGEDHGHGHAGCPSARVLEFKDTKRSAGAGAVDQPSELRQWPIQLHLIPPTAPFLQGADVLLAADCVAFAMGDFHAKHLRGKSLAIACPKLDQGMEIYLEKLVAMIDRANINTLTVMVMEVPCCSGLVHLAQEALARARRKIPLKRLVVGLQGDILGEEWVGLEQLGT